MNVDKDARENDTQADIDTERGVEFYSKYSLYPILLCLLMNGYIRLTSGLINDVVNLTSKNIEIQEEQLQIF